MFSSRLLASIIAVFCCIELHAQVVGRVTEAGAPLIGVNVSVQGSKLGAITDQNGEYEIYGLKGGRHRLVFSLVGYRTQELALDIVEGVQSRMDVELREDLIGLEGVVISATRTEVPIHRAPVIVNVMDDRLFSMTQSLSLSEGLSFSPGLRLENNCQNCGFTQVRMNGLDGAYSQILINSRPVFSALAGVYGLEQIPANMIDRVEIVRGSGSVLYGGNAIAGTVNIITKDPVVNSFEVNTNLGLINGNTPDWTNAVNASVVDDQLKTGISLYALHRNRDFFDANKDGFSEITQMRNTTFGMNSYYKPKSNHRLGLNLYHINEFRRGGDSFDLQPHFSEITEQLTHNIFGAGLTYELSSKDLKNRLGFYTSVQRTNRGSYYGGGGASAYRHLIENNVFIDGPQTEKDFEMLAQFDLAQNAYGQSSDLSMTAGVQWSSLLASNLSLVAGSEYQSSNTIDRIPGYGRVIDQTVQTLGSYVQLEWKPATRLTVLPGGRFDWVRVVGLYQLTNAIDEAQHNSFPVIVPRLSVMYEANDHWKIRSSYAQGYRAPQAFDEDLHVETVGGAARINVLGDDLLVERSDSYTLSSDYSHHIGAWQGSFIAEGFFTQLRNPFINANPEELPSGISIITKRNGDAAIVAGTNLEWRVAVSRRFNFQMGMTLQDARYRIEESIWEPDEVAQELYPELAEVTTDRLLRTPNVYGFLATQWRPYRPLTINISGLYTGRMYVPHVTGPQKFPDTESETLFTYTEIKRTPSFWDINVKISYDFPLNKGTILQVFAGVQNLFNQYQRDFDIGALRDAAYVYGPTRPIMPFFGVKMSYL